MFLKLQEKSKVHQILFPTQKTETSKDFYPIQGHGKKAKEDDNKKKREQ